MQGGGRKIDERGLFADCGDRAATTFNIGSAARHVRADRIGAGVGRKERRRASRVGRSREHGAEGGGESKTNGGIGLVVPGGGERVEIGATTRRGEANLRRAGSVSKWGADRKRRLAIIGRNALGRAATGLNPRRFKGGATAA